MSTQTYSLTVTGSNYKIESNECPWGVIGSCGNVACQFNSETEEVRFTDRAWRNWAPILEAKAEQIEVTDSDAGYSGDVLDFADLVTYLQGVMVSPEGGGGGGGSQVQADWNQTNTSAVDYIKNKPTLRQPASDGTAGQYMKSAGSGNAPVWETMDTTPTESSTKAITSGAVFTALAGKADASTVRFVIHAEYNAGTGAVTLASTTTQAALMAALTAKKAMDIDFTVSGTYYRNPMLSFYEDGTGGHIVKFRNEGIGVDVVLTADTTGNTYSFDTEAINWVGTQAQYDLITTKDPNRIYYITASNS